MIELVSKFQQREVGQDSFGDGYFGYTGVSKDELSMIINKVLRSDTKIEITAFTISRKKFTGLGRAKNVWSKAQSGSRNVLYNPKQRGNSVSSVLSSILDTASEMTSSANPAIYVNSDLVNKVRLEPGFGLLSGINEIKIICN